MTCHLIKSPVTEHLALMAGESIDTAQGSLLYVKRIVAVVVSTWLHSRKVFPESAFLNKQVGNFQLKILSVQSENQSVLHLIQLIKSFAKALDHHYVDQIRFLLTSESGISQPLEEYMFKFKYTSHGIVLLEDQLRSKEQLNETQGNTLQNMQQFSHFLEPVPKRGQLFITVLYNDSITPQVYEPAGFEAYDINNYPQIPDSLKVKFGNIETPFCSAQLSLRSKLIQKDLKDNALETVYSMKSTDQDESLGNSPKIQRHMIKCLCEKDMVDAVMLQCCECKTWQHAVCFGLLNRYRIPAQHICPVCYRKFPMSAVSPSDTYLYSRRQENKDSLCILRRALYLFLKLDHVTVMDIKQKLRIDQERAQCIMNYSLEKGFISMESVKDDALVRKETVLKELKKYFPREEQFTLPSDNSSEFEKSSCGENGSSHNSSPPVSPREQKNYKLSRKASKPAKKLPCRKEIQRQREKSIEVTSRITLRNLNNTDVSALTEKAKALSISGSSGKVYRRRRRTKKCKEKENVNPVDEEAPSNVESGSSGLVRGEEREKEITGSASSKRKRGNGVADDNCLPKKRKSSQCSKSVTLDMD